MFKTYHKTNNFRRYKNKINGFTFPKEILKDQSEMDHIYELIPKFWSYGKLMSTVEDLEISYDDGSADELSCGFPIEVFLPGNERVDEGWHYGRVENREGKYYFFGADKPFLNIGMRARIRID